MSEGSTDEDAIELRDRARRMRALSYHFPRDGDTAEHADELEQRARDLEADRPIGKTSGAT